MPEQPGYDELADLYDQTFPTAYAAAHERAAIDMFAAQLETIDSNGVVVDVGCGTGHQAADLSSRGFDVIATDPSKEMLARACSRFPELNLIQDDARLARVSTTPLAGVLARFSLIHLPPHQLAEVLNVWSCRLRPGGAVLVAFQALGPVGPDFEQFDHAVARAWRWNPDAMSAALDRAGLAEQWRLVVQPAGGYHRFPECHLLHTMPL